MEEGGGFEPPESLTPQRFSKPSHSAALAPFRLARLSALRAESAEELLQESSRFAGEEAVFDRRVVPKAWVAHHVVQACSGTGLEIGSAIYESPDASRLSGTSAHDAWFEGDDKGAIGQAPATQLFARVAQHQHLGVRSRIIRDFAFVVAPRDDLAFEQDHCPHRHVAMSKRGTRFVECDIHRFKMEMRLICHEENVPNRGALRRIAHCLLCCAVSAAPRASAFSAVKPPEPCQRTSPLLSTNTTAIVDVSVIPSGVVSRLTSP